MAKKFLQRLSGWRLYAAIYLSVGAAIGLWDMFGSYLLYHSTSYLQAPLATLVINFLGSVFLWPAALLFQYYR